MPAARQTARTVVFVADDVAYKQVLVPSARGVRYLCWEVAWKQWVVPSARGIRYLFREILWKEVLVPGAIKTRDLTVAAYEWTWPRAIYATEQTVRFTKETAWELRVQILFTWDITKDCAVRMYKSRTTQNSLAVLRRGKTLAYEGFLAACRAGKRLCILGVDAIFDAYEWITKSLSYCLSDVLFPAICETSKCVWRYFLHPVLRALFRFSVALFELSRAASKKSYSVTVQLARKIARRIADAGMLYVFRPGRAALVFLYENVVKILAFSRDRAKNILERMVALSVAAWNSVLWPLFVQPSLALARHVSILMIAAATVLFRQICDQSLAALDWASGNLVSPALQITQLVGEHLYAAASEVAMWVNEKSQVVVEWLRSWMEEFFRDLMVAGAEAMAVVGDGWVKVTEWWDVRRAVYAELLAREWERAGELWGRWVGEGSGEAGVVKGD